MFPFAVIALTVLIAPSVGGANPSSHTASLRAQDAAIVAKSRAAVLGLYSLDRQLAAAQSKLASLRRQTASLRRERQSLRRQLAVAKVSTRISQARAAQRLRLLYEQDNVEPLEIVLGSKTLDEALTNLDELNRSAGQSEEIVRELAAARKAIVRASHGLAARTTALAAATRAAEATAASLAATRAQRSSYISSLAAQRRLTERQISNLVTAANAAQVRSTGLERGGATFATSTGSRVLTVSATAYALPGYTASGLPVGWGVVAVDPSVIPMGTHMTVPGYGDAVAADVGTAIIGARIDLWFPTIAQADAWGRRVVTIVLH